MSSKRILTITTISVFIFAFLWIGQATLTRAADLRPNSLSIVNPLVDSSIANVHTGTITLSETFKLTSSTPITNGRYGRSVAIYSDTLIVSEITGQPNGIDVGALYVHERHAGGFNNWGVTKIITSSDNTTGVGDSLAFDGDTLIAGAAIANGNSSQSGVAYIFARNYGGVNNWGEMAKLIAPDGANGDRFGWTVSLDGDTAVVGARWHDGSGITRGSAYIYERNQGGLNNWGFVKELTASNPANNARFGYAVAVENDTIIVGSDNRFSTVSGGGVVYIYERNLGGANNWGEITQITPSTPASGARFGAALDIDGDRIAVGAIDLNTSRTGGVYIFERDEGGINNWGEIIELRPSDGTANNVFGGNVSIEGDTLYVGAWAGVGVTNATGAAYVIKQDPSDPRQWNEVEKHIASNGATGDEFGRSVSFFGNTFVVGAFHHDDFCPNNSNCNSGAAYIFTPVFPVDVAIEKSVSNVTAVPNQAITYTLTYTNNGPDIAFNTLITDIVPATIVNPVISNSGPNITLTGVISFVWQVAPLSPNESGTITITGMIDPNLTMDTTITNTAVITNSLDITPTNNIDTAVIQVITPKIVYLPAIMLPNAQTFPIFIGDPIPIQATIQGAIFYTATIAIASNIPTTGQFFLSSQPNQISPIVVDDELAIMLNGNELFVKLFSSAGQLVQPEIVELPRPIAEQMAGQTVAIIYRDVYGYSVSASSVWLIWVP